MAVIATTTVTITIYRDTQSVTRYYKLQLSSLAAPTVSQSTKPSALAGLGWGMTEPEYSFDDGSEEDYTLYFFDASVFSNSEWLYSNVSVSSSYELAKEAHNKAILAQESVDNAQNAIDNTKAYTHTALSIDGGNTLTYFDFAGHMELGKLVNGVDTDSEVYARSIEYVKLMNGYTYNWNIVDLNGTSLKPTTYFYKIGLVIDQETGDETEGYVYVNSQFTNEITVPNIENVNDIYMRFTIDVTPETSDPEYDPYEKMSNITYELELDDIDTIIDDQTMDVYMGININLVSYMSLNSFDYEWELTDESTLKNATELAEKLNEQLYNETNGDIKQIQDGIAGVQNNINDVVNDVDLYKTYVQIEPDDPSITLLATDSNEKYGNKVVITDKKISFCTVRENSEIEGAAIGYIDDEQTDRTSMAVSKTYVTEMYPRVEDPTSTQDETKWIGSLCWIARSNGHLSLKVVD